MMSARIAILAVLCCALAVNATVTELPIGQTQWHVAYKSVVYNVNDDTTSFNYEVTTGAEPLGHFVITSTCSKPLVDGSDFVDRTQSADASTGKKGYVYPIGQDPSTTVPYSLVFKGDVAIAPAGYAVKEGQHFAADTPTAFFGPACSGSSASGGSLPYADLNKTCSEMKTFVYASADLVNTDINGKGCPGNYEVVNTYQKAVGTTFFTEKRAIIFVTDSVAPTIDIHAPHYIELKCDEAIPPLPTGVTASDDCDPAPLLAAPCVEITNGSCPANTYILRSWTATDHCGNTKCVTQTIAQIDNEPPVITGVPPSKTLECTTDRSLPPLPVVHASDRCGCFKDDLPFTYKQVRKPGECANTYDLITTWTSTDCCGNTATASYTVTVTDNTAPTIHYTDPNWVPGKTYDCDKVPARPDVYATDDCTDANVVIVPVANTTRIDGSCPSAYQLLWEWTATDECGNVGTKSETINVRDPIPPAWKLSSLPASVTVECGSVPAVGNPEATDNCFEPTISYLGEKKTPGLCPNEYTLNRTWSAADSCGNTIYHTQIITVIDTTPTKIDPLSVPQLGPFKCFSEVPSLAGTEPSIQALPDSTGCDGFATLSSSETPVVGTCVNKQTIYRYYTLTDCSGNKDTVNTTIVVNDDVKPVLIGVPADVSVECDNVPAQAVVHTADNCDCPATATNPHPDCITPTYVETRINGSCPHSYTLKRTWTVTDICGNTDSATQTITVSKSSKPTISDIPADVTVQCDAIPARPAVTGHTNCGTFTITTPADDKLPGSCDNQYTIKRHWHIQDECGNFNDYTQTINVIDTTFPTLTGVPADETVSCANVPAPADVCASDNCLGVTVTFSQTRTDQTCGADGVFYKLVRTWTATDACGNTVSQSQTIKVTDPINPQFNGTPQNLFQSCDNVQVPAAPTATDSCTSVTVTNHSHRGDGSCQDSYVLYESYKATDFCGNNVWYNFTITVSDTAKPTISNVPADRTDTCAAGPSAMPTASDLCDPNPSVSAPVDTNTSYTCPYIYTVRRTWTASDRCGNTDTASQIIQVTDPGNPVFQQNIIPQRSAQCEPNPPPTVTAKDACFNDATVNMVPVRTNGSCVYDYTLVRTWTATDVCGKTNTLSETWRIKDTTAPTIGGVPADTTALCTPPLPAKVCGSDNCLGVSLTFKEDVVNTTCTNGYTIKRTWTATDLCGNTKSESQFITVYDNVKPSFTTPNPGDSSATCFNGQISAPQATDNCGAVPVVTNHTWVESGDCPYHYKVHVAFKATDACGNFEWWNYTVTVGDATAPQISWTPDPPTDGTFTCASPPAAPVPSVVDNCGGATVTGPVETISGKSCDNVYTLTRVWTINDACNNGYTVTQILTGVNNGNPVFDNAPGDTSKRCQDPLVTLPVTATDSCGHAATVSGPIDSNQTGSCADQYDIVRVWTATDVCGLQTTHTQTVHVYDNESPTIVVPAQRTSVNNECTADLVGTPTVTDNCDPAPAWTANQTEKDRTCAYRYTKVNHYYANDRCGNPSSATQDVVYSWNTVPTLLNTPPSVTAECDAVPAPATVTAKDGCNVPLTPTYTQTRHNGSCPNSYTLERVWSVKDDCDVPASYTQIVTVRDTTVPTLCNVPADITVQCGFIPDPATVTANDNCDGVTIAYTEDKIPGSNCCDYKLKRKWVATDACGNKAESIQTITVIDRIPPQLEGVPSDRYCVECPFTLDNPNVTAHKPALAYGYCVDQTYLADACYHGGAAASSVTIDGVLYTYEPASTFVTWFNGMAQFELHLKNPTGDAFLVQIVLDQATAFAALPANVVPQKDLDASCYPGQADPSVWTYYLSANGTLSGGASSIAFKSSALKTQVGLGASGRTTEWGVTVFADYEASAGGLQTAAFHLSVTQDGEGSCFFNHTELPHFECNDPIPVVLNTTHTPGSCAGAETITREWCATDESGNKACAVQIITVCDTTAPEIAGVPPTESVSCDASIPVAPATVSDACDANPKLWYNDTKIDGSCPGSYVIERRYTAVDSCGNVDHALETINVYDTAAPSLTVPGPVQAQCDNVPAFGPTDASDNCGIVLGANNPVHSDTNSTGPQHCPESYVITRTWTVTDQCGNPTTKSSTITVRDDNKPTISGAPTSSSLECKAPVPVGTPSAADACAGDITSAISTSENIQNTNCPNLYTKTITYNVQDHCGNAADPVSWSYTYIDTTNPTWNQAMPANVTVQCDQIPAVPTISAGDACNYANTSYSTWQVGPANGDCAHNYVIFRKWVATDCAGNSISHTQAITVIDTTNPVITPGTVADVTATCKAVPNPPDFCVTDNCDGVSTVWTDVRTNSNGQPNSCDQYVRNRTLVATDACGNTVSVSYTVTVNDQTAPTCTRTPDFSVSCEADNGDAPPVPTCSDDCSTVHIELLAPEESQGPQSCTQSKYRHWAYKITDDCGNTAWSNTTVTIYDNTAPVLHNVPTGETFQCGTAEPADPVTASDNCDTPSVVREDVRSTVVCAGVYDLTRTWFTVDACGNKSPNSTVTYHFIDDTKPQFQQPMPANTTVQCHQVPAVDVVTGTDNCDANPSITFKNWTVAGSCDNQYTIYREWTITDCSGNSDKWLQEIQVIDTTFPTSTDAPPSSTVQCHTVPEPPTLCADDNCVGVTLDYHQVRTNLPGAITSCNDQYYLNRSWIATDACGNSVEKFYTITVADVVPPTCAPSSITPKSYSCENRANTAPSRPQCSEDCSTVTYEEFPVHVPGSCAYNYVDYFNFKATDDCGNSVWVNTSVEIYDNTKPHFITTPADATVECSAIPAREDPTWGDNCGTVTLDSYTEVPAVAPTGCKNYEIKRTWVIKDECGNTNTHVQTLTVQDTQKPQWVLPLPTDKTFQCDEVYPDPTLSATDNCGTPVTVRTITTVPGSCNNQYDKVYTWNTTDDCGNFDTYSVTYHIIDTEKPTFNVIPPAQVSATCDNVPKPDDVCCSDSCDGVKLDFVQTRTDMGCSSRYSLNRTWICTDNCGNVATTTQIVIVTDTNKPTFNQIPVGTKSYECVHTDSQVVLTANDTCTGANVNMTETLVPGECAHNYTVVRKWQAMDDCGNEDWVYQNVSVQDTLPPHVDQSNISCYSVNNYLKDQVVVYNLTQEGNVFTTGDACSGTVSPTDALPRPLSPFNYPPSTDAPATTIEYYSCSSDLDAWFGNGCNYDGSLDQLTLEADMDPINNKTGRLYTIVVKVTDQCGHSVFGSHQILIPFDQFSASLRGLPADVNCVVAPGSCDENCACQTVDHFCTAGSDFGSLSGSQSFANGNTEFKYVLSASTTSAAAQLVQIAVDLTKYEIVSTSPAGAELGYQFGSALYGISWKNFPAGTTQFSFTVAGTVSTVGPVSYLLGVGLDTNDAKPANYPTCSDVRTVNGPVAAPSFTGANGDISGKVVISGARFGVTRAFNFPLADVVVGLRNVGSNSFLRKATTDATGSYTFHDVDAAGKEVIIVEDGLLRSGGQITKFRNSKSFLRATVNIIFGQPTYGVAQSASDPIFKLLLDDEATPKYSRQQNNNDFEGNSKPWYYWLHQKDGLGASDFNSAEWAAINAQASSICTTFSGTGNTIENQLTGAAYNIAAGFGIFEPYDEVQTWMFAFAQHVHCGGAADPVDEAIALKFAQRINDADDNDRS